MERRCKATARHSRACHFVVVRRIVVKAFENRGVIGMSSVGVQADRQRWIRRDVVVHHAGRGSDGCAIVGGGAKTDLIAAARCGLIRLPRDHDLIGRAKGPVIARLKVGWKSHLLCRYALDKAGTGEKSYRSGPEHFQGRLKFHYALLLLGGSYGPHGFSWTSSRLY